MLSLIAISAIALLTVCLSCQQEIDQPIKVPGPLTPMASFATQEELCKFNK